MFVVEIVNVLYKALSYSQVSLYKRIISLTNHNSRFFSRLPVYTHYQTVHCQPYGQKDYVT